MKFSRNCGRLFTSVICLVLLLALTINISLATSVDVIPIKQAKDNWCWAACAEMAGKTAFKSVYNLTSYRTQYNVVEKLKGTSSEPYPDETGSISESATASKYVTYDYIEFASTGSKWSFAKIESSLNDGYAVQAGAGYYNLIFRKSGHMVVIYETKTVGSENYVSYIDPLFPDEDYCCTYEEFCNGTYNDRKYDQTVYVK